MSTLSVVEGILHETRVPMSVREIVERAGLRLPSRSNTPDTVVARDLSMDIKKNGDGSRFVRTAPGRFTLRALAMGNATAIPAAPSTPMSALPGRRPVASAPIARGVGGEAKGGLGS